MAVKIEKETIIGDVLDIAPQSAPLFFAIGMHCLGCPSSRGETVEEACMVHGVDCEPFLAQLNHFLEAYEAAEAEKKYNYRLCRPGLPAFHFIWRNQHETPPFQPSSGLLCFRQ